LRMRLKLCTARRRPFDEHYGNGEPVCLSPTKTVVDPTSKLAWAPLLQWATDSIADPRMNSWMMASRLHRMIQQVTSVQIDDAGLNAGPSDVLLPPSRKKMRAKRSHTSVGEIENEDRGGDELALRTQNRLDTSPHPP